LKEGRIAGEEGYPQRHVLREIEGTQKSQHASPTGRKKNTSPGRPSAASRNQNRNISRKGAKAAKKEIFSELGVLGVLARE